MSDKRTHPGVGYAHPHAEAAKNVAGQIDHTHVKADLGTAPKPKRAFTTAPQVHSGMMAKSRKDGTHFAGLSGQDLSRYDANPGDDPLSGAPRGKVVTPVQPHSSMRSRTNDALASGTPGAAHAAHQANKDAFIKGMQDMSKGVLGEASQARGSGVFDRARFGALPQQVDEE